MYSVIGISESKLMICQSVKKHLELIEFIRNGMECISVDSIFDPMEYKRKNVDRSRFNNGFIEPFL